MKTKIYNVLHHLRYCGGCWQLRFTVKTGKDLIGRRVVCSLRTADQKEAMARRDILLRAMRKADLLELHLETERELDTARGDETDG